MWGPLSIRDGELWLSLESPHGFRPSLHHVWWLMNLHLSHCRETRPSFESGHLGVHSTWGRKHRVPLTYLFLREGSSWGACGKLAYLFSRRQGIILIQRWYGEHWTFLQMLYCNWWSSILEKVLSGNLSMFLKGVKRLILYDVDHGVVMAECKGNGPHFSIILGTPCNFAFVGWNQCSSRLLTVLLGTLWSSFKQIEAPYVFDWENAIPLETIQGNRASSRREGQVSWVFSSFGRNLGYILELRRGCPFELEFVQWSQDTCLGMRDNSGM